MGVLPVNKLLINMSLPMMASMLVQALYNIVDSIFVSKINENALTAVSMAFPIQCLVIALGIGIGVGINAVLSKALGGKEFDKVNKAATNGIFLAAICFVLFFIVGLTCIRPFYLSQTQDEEIIEFGVQYMTIICTCSFAVYSQFVFERLLTSTGRTFLTMITQGTGAIVNIILDPMFIFGIGFFPRMGVAGAAVATVIGQAVAAVMAIIFNLKKNPEVTISFKGFKPDGEVIGEILRVGIPTIIMQAIGSVMNYIMNRVLIGFTSTAVAVFGVYYKMQSFIFMPIFGLNGGMVPIIAYNYGAKRRDRLMKTWKLALVYAIGIMTIGTILFETIPGLMFKLFSASPEMMDIGITAFREIGVHFPVAGFCIITGTLFQSLGKSTYSMIVSIMRQVVVLIPAILILASFGNVNLVWWAFPIAEVMSAAATALFYGILYKKIISKI